MTVEEILDYLDVIFRNYFKGEEAQDQYTRQTQQPEEDFNDFYSELAYLATLGEISPEV